MEQPRVVSKEEVLLCFEDADLGPPGAVSPTLRSVSLQLSAGEVGVLLGGNGAGKSTLLRSAAGLWPPLRGTIRNGNGTGFDPKRTGLILEEPAAQFVAGTVAGELEFALECQGISGETVRSRVTEVLEDLELDHLARRDPRSLSCGEQQRALVAAAVVSRPPVLLLDDSFLHMGPGEGIRIWRWLVGRIRSRKEQILLLAGHVSDLAVDADRVGVLEQGMLGSWASPARALREVLPPEIEPPLGVWLETRLAGLGWELSSGSLDLRDLGSWIGSELAHDS